MSNITRSLEEAVRFFNAGLWEKAETAAHDILRLQSDNVVALNLLGMISGQSGRFDAAADYFRMALAQAPHDADILANLAEALRFLGRPGEAVPLLRQAIEIAPGYVIVHRKLTATLLGAGHPEEALAACLVGLGHHPGDPDLNGLAADLLWRQNPEQAASHLHTALTNAPDSDPNWLRLGRLLQTACLAPTPEVRSWLLTAMARPVIRPDDIAWSTGMTLCRDPVIARLIAAAAADELPDGVALSEILAQLSGDSLLLALMKATVIPSLPLEQLFTGLRRALMRNAETLVLAPDAQRFCAALAIQSFLTDYAWYVSDEETALFEAFEASLHHINPSAGPVALPTQLCIFGCYRPIYRLARAGDLTQQTNWPASLTELYRVQLLEPLEERSLREQIPQLTPISNPVSLRVRAQYEEHPYPRWIRAGNVAGRSLLHNPLVRRAGVEPMDSSFAAPEVLIAGCGTGLQSMVASYSYPHAKILAIDLSLTSLTYAYRKTRELGIANIEYRHGDIMELGELERRFHVIESGGVLHHLDDPVAGWKILANLLYPNGLMNIGLYSELARREVRTARAYIAEKGYTATTEDIRRCRRDLLTLPEDHPLASLRLFRDLYNISECRDLLFHVQEHRFTLPSIAGILNELGLRFLGFLSLTCEDDYQLRFPDDPAMISLANWHQYELEHPDTFAGMYNFLAQKI